MNKKTSMLREKRRHANYKPNRRLDAKSSRGMIYENEELRLRTININAEVERGQSEIKSLKREREQLRREIWTLRDEYDKLERLLRIKGINPDEFINNNQNTGEQVNDDNGEDECSSSCSCSSQSQEEEDGEGSGEHEPDCPKNAVNKVMASSSSSTPANEAAINEDLKKTKEKLRVNFDHLSIVSEENLTNSSDCNTIIHCDDLATTVSDISSFLHKADAVSPLSYLQSIVPPLKHFENINYDEIGGNFDKDTGKYIASASSPTSTDFSNLNNDVTKMPKHFFSPIRKPQMTSANQPDVFVKDILPNNLLINPIPNGPTNFSVESSVNVVNNNDTISQNSSFQNGGNLEELLYDIETLSKDILELSTQCKKPGDSGEEMPKKPYKSEINLFLAYPTPDSPISEEPTYPIYSSSTQLPASPIVTQPPITNMPSANMPVPGLPMPMANLEHRELGFTPLMTQPSMFSSTNSLQMCTVSAPTTPAVDRKFDESTEGDVFDKNNNKSDNNSDKNKKLKRVSYSNKEEGTEKNENEAGTSDLNTSKTSIVGEDGKKHHAHKNHNHSHQHSKSGHNRRLSLDTNQSNGQNAAGNRHKNHRMSHDSQMKDKERSNLSLKKRSRSESTFTHDLDQGAGTSVSERYSNSIASSRESSTSLSSKSQVKRRISITSHGGSSKIPWCGCWGNGCL